MPQPNFRGHLLCFPWSSLFYKSQYLNLNLISKCKMVVYFVLIYFHFSPLVLSFIYVFFQTIVRVSYYCLGEQVTITMYIILRNVNVNIMIWWLSPIHLQQIFLSEVALQSDSTQATECVLRTILALVSEELGSITALKIGRTMNNFKFSRYDFLF